MKKIVEYGKENFKPLAITTVLFLIYFLPYLNNSMIGIDTFVYINFPGTTYNWLEIGRQGGILINKIFFKNPQWSMFFCEGMAFVTYILAMICFCYLFDVLAHISTWKTCFFFLVYMISPIWTEQFYFTMQIFPVAVGSLLLPISLFLVYRSKRIYWVFSILLMLILFSIYQTFVILYIAGCILCFLLLYYNNAKQYIDTEKYFWLKLGIRQFLLFLIGFIANTIITNKYFMSSSYLTGQKLWGKISIVDCIRNVLAHIKCVVKGESIFYTRWCTVSMIAVIVLVLLFLLKQRKLKEKILPFLAICILQTTPFLLTVYNAAAPAVRSLFIYPFVFACNILLIFVLFSDIVFRFEKVFPKTWNKYILLFIYFGSMFVLIGQYYETSQQQYTETYMKKRDELLAYGIEQRIVEETSENGKITKPVVFTGLYTCPTNNMFMGGDAVTWSTFNFSAWALPRFRHTHFFVIPYMQSLGIPISSGSEEQIANARIEGQTMTIFPSEGSIRDMGDHIIVKIGDDPWYEEDGLPPVT